MGISSSDKNTGTAPGLQSGPSAMVPKMFLWREPRRGRCNVGNGDLGSLFGWRWGLWRRPVDSGAIDLCFLADDDEGWDFFLDGPPQPLK